MAQSVQFRMNQGLGRDPLPEGQSAKKEATEHRATLSLRSLLSFHTGPAVPRDAAEETSVVTEPTK